ncbi:MAG TPA: DNA recombination protein RmuC [Treponemataceae bacterium]|nr:DNA recombination protein RmuC [Treponemataceae bacterium]HPL91944.1 DNA recombination protein RmuC [Treponemataceae bacterium]
MLEIIVMLAIIIVVLLVILLIKQFSNKTTDISPQMIDLRNQIDDLKTKQLENQTSSLSQQQSLLIKTQTEIREQLSQIMKNVGETLSSSQGNINNQLKASNEVIGEIQKKLGSLEATTKNIQDISKDISSLQEILQAPKLRGNLGEYLLEELLKDILPPQNYAMKYNFKNGTQVDAVIKLGEGMVPVDSKFPLESFQRLVKAETDEDKKSFKKEFVNSVKKRIDEIVSKYINPAENTFEFAMMYIPAENVFYETIINDSLTNKEYELFNYAIKNHVIPVSPNSFYAYLMAIGYGLKGFKIEQQAKTIIGELSKVQDSFGKFYTDFTMLGKHIGNAESKYTDLTKKADKINDQVTKITGVKYDLLESDVEEN